MADPRRFIGNVITPVRGAGTLIVPDLLASGPGYTVDEDESV
jgi:hypothetical protein